MNFNKICVYDFETDGTNPNICNPVQISAVMVHPRSLTKIKDSEFTSFICPPTILDKDGALCPKYVEKHKNTIQWHANTRKIKFEEVLDLWKNAPPEKEVFSNFQQYLLKYHKDAKYKNKFSAPISAGYNILRFDNVIFQRLCEKYGAVDKDGDMNIFHPRDKIDIMHIMFLFFENNGEIKSYSMDALRPYFGISEEGAHDAFKDVEDTTELTMRFLRLARHTAERTQFKGALKSV